MCVSKVEAVITDLLPILDVALETFQVNLIDLTFLLVGEEVIFTDIRRRLLVLDLKVLPLAIFVLLLASDGDVGRRGMLSRLDVFHRRHQCGVRLHS